MDSSRQPHAIHRGAALGWPWRAALLSLLCVLSACATPTPPTPPAAGEQPSFHQTGLASWYGADHQGKLTASGERFDMHALTAAHRALPFNTVARITSVASGRMVKVRINDRGPTAKSRIVDLSAAAGAAIGIAQDGEAPVRVEVFASDQH